MNAGIRLHISPLGLRRSLRRITGLLLDLPSSHSRKDARARTHEQHQTNLSKSKETRTFHCPSRKREHSTGQLSHVGCLGQFLE